MNKLDFDNLISQINKEVDEMNYEFETNNSFYQPIYKKIFKTRSIYEWLLILFTIFTVCSIYIIDRMWEVYEWYIAIAPTLIIFVITFIFLIKYLKYNKKLKQTKKEWDKAITKANDLNILITRHSNIARDEILDRLKEDKDQVIRIVGTSLPDLLEYYDYYLEFIENHPNEKPEIKRIKPCKYDFEKVVLNQNYTDEEVIYSIKRDMNKNNYLEIISLIKTLVTKGHLKIYAFIYSTILNYYPKKIRTQAYKELIDNEKDKLINGINFYSYLYDIKTYNKRNYKTYTQNMDKNSFYYLLITIFNKHNIYDTYNHNNAKPLEYIINIFLNNSAIMNPYEQNELLKLIYSFGLNNTLTLPNKVINQYINLYNNYSNILRNDCVILYHKRMTSFYLENSQFDRAEKELFEIKLINSNDFFYLTNSILIKYNIKTFKELFKLHNYNTLKEFLEIESLISSKKDIELSNELYNFKKRYLN